MCPCVLVVSDDFCCGLATFFPLTFSHCCCQNEILVPDKIIQMFLDSMELDDIVLLINGDPKEFKKKALEAVDALHEEEEEEEHAEESSTQGKGRKKGKGRGKGKGRKGMPLEEE